MLNIVVVFSIAAAAVALVLQRLGAVRTARRQRFTSASRLLASVAWIGVLGAMTLAMGVRWGTSISHDLLAGINIALSGIAVGGAGYALAQDRIAKIRLPLLVAFVAILGLFLLHGDWLLTLGGAVTIAAVVLSRWLFDSDGAVQSDEDSQAGQPDMIVLAGVGCATLTVALFVLQIPQNSVGGRSTDSSVTEQEQALAASPGEESPQVAARSIAAASISQFCAILLLGLGCFGFLVQTDSNRQSAALGLILLAVLLKICAAERIDQAAASQTLVSSFAVVGLTGLLLWKFCHDSIHTQNELSAGDAVEVPNEG